MWLLNEPELQLEAEERESRARTAPENLMTDPGVRLVKLRWPQPDALEELALKDLPETLWTEPGALIKHMFERGGFVKDDTLVDGGAF